MGIQQSSALCLRHARLAEPRYTETLEHGFLNQKMRDCFFSPHFLSTFKTLKRKSQFDATITLTPLLTLLLFIFFILDCTMWLAES